jgi:enhancing lycopene biosynthesis protein 2
MSKPIIAVLLSGCGVYDGTEIHESVLTLFNVDKEGGEYICIAPDTEQYHVVNHITGDETTEKRNVLIESARIARGKIKNLKDVTVNDFDALVIPGGFGAAKNLTTWAFKGHESEILPDVKRIILEFVSVGKPIAAFCMGPTVVAKALEGTSFSPKLTVGTTEKPSPYDIKGISNGMEKLGALTEMTSVEDITVDETYKIITAPCYMMDSTVYEINFGIAKAIKKLMKFIG